MGTETTHRLHPIRIIRSFPIFRWFFWTPHWTCWIHQFSVDQFIDFVLEWVLRVCANFWTLVVRPRSSSTVFCGTPGTRKSILNVFSCLAIGFSVLVCCWVFCIVLYLPSFYQRNFGRPSRSRHPLLQNLVMFDVYHSLNTVGWHWVVKVNGVWSSLPECYSFIMCFSQVDPVNCVLSCFPLAFVLHLSWFR